MQNKNLSFDFVVTTLGLTYQNRQSSDRHCKDYHMPHLLQLCPSLLLQFVDDAYGTGLLSENSLGYHKHCQDFHKPVPLQLYPALLLMFLFP